MYAFWALLSFAGRAYLRWIFPKSFYTVTISCWSATPKKTQTNPKQKTTKKQPTNPHNSEPLRSCFFQTLKYFCIKGLGSLIFAYLAVRNVFRKREMLWERMGYGGKCSAVLPRATAVQLFERLEENPESSMPKCVDSAKKPDAAMGSIMYLF